MQCTAKHQSGIRLIFTQQGQRIASYPPPPKLASLPRLLPVFRRRSLGTRLARELSWVLHCVWVWRLMNLFMARFSHIPQEVLHGMWGALKYNNMQAATHCSPVQCLCMLFYKQSSERRCSRFIGNYKNSKLCVTFILRYKSTRGIFKSARLH